MQNDKNYISQPAQGTTARKKEDSFTIGTQSAEPHLESLIARAEPSQSVASLLPPCPIDRFLKSGQCISRPERSLAQKAIDILRPNRAKIRVEKENRQEQISQLTPESNAIIQKIMDIFGTNGKMSNREFRIFVDNIKSLKTWTPNGTMFINKQIFEKYDVNRDGSLDINEFTYLILKWYETYHLLFDWLSEMVDSKGLGEDFTSCPLAAKFKFLNETFMLRHLPPKDSIIPGTSHTYRSLLNAVSVAPSKKDVHRAAAQSNIVLAANILEDSSRAKGLTVPSNTYLPSNAERQIMNRRIYDALNEYLSFPEFPYANKEEPFLDDTYRRRLIQGIIKYIDNRGEGWKLIYEYGGNNYSSYYIWNIILNFLQQQTRSFQTQWAIAVVSDIVEAYGSTIATWGNLSESQQDIKASCRKGITERLILYLGSVILQASETIDITKETPLDTKNRRKTMLEQWKKEYITQLDASTPFTISGLRNFLITKIRSLNGDNIPDNWKEDLGVFFKPIKISDDVDVANAEIIKNTRRSKLLQAWLEKYFRETPDEQQSIDNFRIFINQLISIDNQDNNPDNWRVQIEEFLNEPGINMMFGGRARKYRYIKNALFGKKQMTKKRITKKRFFKTKHIKKRNKKITKNIKKRKHKTVRKG